MKPLILSSIAYKLSMNDKVGLTPEKEGGYGTNDGHMINILQELLGAKYAIDSAYRSFSDRIRGPWRDSLVDHWHEHAKEERQNQYDIAMKLVGMGADPMISVITVPQCPSNLEAFCVCLAKMELEAINKSRELISLSGDNTSMKVFAENVILTDTQHLDDLRRLSDSVHKAL